MNHLVKAKAGKIKYNIDPQRANWNYLGYQVLALKEGDTHKLLTEGNEAAIVPLGGKTIAKTDGKHFELNRKGVFIDKPHVLYCPPKHEITFEAITDCEIAIGTAPAEGRYPLRLFLPEEQKVEVRGGGPAIREVHHTLSHPMPAERLILYEVYVPGGMWSGWPPHRHDGINNSPYLEETYHFKLVAMPTTKEENDGLTLQFTLKEVKISSDVIFPNIKGPENILHYEDKKNMTKEEIAVMLVSTVYLPILLN